MSSMAESKVTGIIQSLNNLEADIDSLSGSLTDMKKQLSSKTQSEIDRLLEKTRDMATKEAELIINESKEKANSDAKKISQEGESKIEQIKSKIDTNFDEAVKHVVSTVLKA